MKRPQSRVRFRFASRMFAVVSVALLGAGVFGARLAGAREAAGGAGAAKPTASSDEDLVHEFAAYVDALAQEDRFSGVVLVAKDGVPEYVKAHGLADRSRGVPNREDTKFNLGFASKMFSASATLCHPNTTPNGTGSAR